MEIPAAHPVPMFAELEPGLSAAERAFAQRPAFAALLAAIRSGDADDAARQLNSRLAAADTTIRLQRRGDSWVIVADGTSPAEADELFSVARLVAADGWRRIKICAASTCGTAFIDRTNGNLRRYCTVHRSHRS